VKLEVVVCRFNKGVDWVNGLKNCRVTIYNKGKDDLALPDGSDATVIPQENVSYEDFTILSHILSRWGFLADVTVFVQDDVTNPDLHIGPDFVRVVNEGFDDLEEVRPLWEVPDAEADGSCKPPVPLKEVYERLLGREWPGKIQFARSSLVAVPKAKIEQHGRGFYERALGELRAETDKVDGFPRGRSTFIFERLWLEVFK